MSWTWVSLKTREFEAYTKVKGNLPHVAPNSPFVPKCLNAWFGHRVAMKDEESSQGKRQIATFKANKPITHQDIIRPTFAGKLFSGFRSPVLAMESIWRPDQEELPSRPHAPWPELDELKHEGYQRSRSGYNRFPPLPRVRGNATVNWKQRAPIVPFDFDAVGRPTMAYDETAPETDTIMASLIGASLQEHLECEEVTTPSVNPEEMENKFQILLRSSSVQIELYCL